MNTKTTAQQLGEARETMQHLIKTDSPLRESGGQIGEILEELDQPALTEMLGVEAIELLKQQTRIAGSDFRYLGKHD